MQCLVAIALFAVTACSHQNQPVHEPFLREGIDIVKLESPEYLDYVIADSYGDSLFGIRYENECSAQELFLGTSPYIALPDGYYAIDWKWGHFVYSPTNYLLSVKWEEVKDRRQRWGWDKMKLSSGFILREFGFSYAGIDKFLNIAPPPVKDDKYPKEYKIPGWLYFTHSLSDITDSVRLQQYLDEVKFQDSLQATYVERVSRIIEEGRLEEFFDSYSYYGY